ncbi:GntR family transcriptional regulator [Catellatospora chokoriensis]|uniref:GntR family transcriptional regulator n=1 Tax=Catellatospora chokoriensis TaxID=310353 RepID=A0A8J3NRC0_9ACTN|nr:GntR family transcriptional regulator [Catellatospora chokoriensis]GIF90042.1 GntR family transcriptional regulator [Catellatospora chokoriensis]
MIPTITIWPGPVPPYEQIRAQVEALINGGLLAPGHRLPPIRQLAADLGLATGTVARAYQELESAGLVTTRRAAGTVVAARAPAPPTDRRGPLAQAAHGYTTTALTLGADLDEALAAIRAAWPSP